MKEQAEKDLKTAYGENLCSLLIGISEIEDWKWAQDIYLKYLNDRDQWVATAAITGLGHLARISKNLEKEKVIGALEELSKNNPKLKGKIRDAISDINIFL